MTAINIMKNAKGLEYVRTPEECFDNLPNFPFKANYLEVNDWRQHYVDEGPRDGHALAFPSRQLVWPGIQATLEPQS